MTSSDTAGERSSGQMLAVRSRVRGAIAKHGYRGTPFAVARRIIESLESKLNPHHVNVFHTGYSDVVTAPTDPVSAVYSAELQTLVIEMPLSDLRWSRLGIGFDPAGNPFVRNVMDHLSGAHLAYDGSALERHYLRWTPTSAAEALGLRDSAGPIATQPADSLVLPWMPYAREVDADQRLERLDRWNREESRVMGFDLDRSRGHKYLGPVDQEFGQFEYARYTALAERVRSDGFLPRGDDGYIGVQLLVRDDRTVGVITGPGLHRSIVAAAFGIDPLIVAASHQPPLVHRSDAARWPGVRAGLFTEAEALAVFDRVVDGEAPAGWPPID